MIREVLIWVLLLYGTAGSITAAFWCVKSWREDRRRGVQLMRGDYLAIGYLCCGIAFVWPFVLYSILRWKDNSTEKG